MEEYGPSTYGDRWAEIYDEWGGALPLATEETVEQLAELAGVGRAGARVFVPDRGRFDRGQRTRTLRVQLDEVELHADLHDPVEQVVTSQHVVMREGGLQLYPVKIRYAWPSELDLMARLAGLELRERWGGWRREAFTATSGRHVSVYGRA
jgi:hypothetical protein